MNKNVLFYLDKLLIKYTDLILKLNDTDLVNNKDIYIFLLKEIASIEDLVLLYVNYNKILKQIVDLKELLYENSDIESLILEEIFVLKKKKSGIEFSIKKKMNFEADDNVKSIFLEIRAATGGMESSIFVSNLLRMYMLYFNEKKWNCEDVDENYTECGGYKDVVKRVIGKNVYSRMKYESGVHRVQRIPKTENRGRVHTSTSTVAVLPEVDIVGNIDISSNDLRIDTFKASGAGGQHVNKTDSAVRVTYIPTGIFVECQAERSQHKNKARALSYLKSKLLADMRCKQRNEINLERKNIVGKGDRSDKIRTYNFVQNRITDHRINLSVYNLLDVMNGNLDFILDKLVINNTIF